MTRAADRTFLAHPGEVADWRATLLLDAAASTGVLARLPATADEVAGGLALDPQGARALLDALVAVGTLAVSAGGVYTPTGDVPDQGGLAAVGHHARAIRRWATVLQPRLRGEAVENPGIADPEQFHDSLANQARAGAPAVVDACLARFPSARSVLDLGGLHGEYSLEFARRGLRATMQDLPAMIDVARRRGRLEAAGVALYEGSFFEAVPEGPFDIAFCSGITHTFDGEGNQTLYRNLRPVVSGEGGVAVVTFLRGRSPEGALFAVQMFINANGGDTHTEDEYRGWLTGSGFAVDPGVVDLAGTGAPRSILFATPRADE